MGEISLQSIWDPRQESFYFSEKKAAIRPNISCNNNNEVVYSKGKKLCCTSLKVVLYNTIHGKNITNWVDMEKTELVKGLNFNIFK